MTDEERTTMTDEEKKTMTDEEKKTMKAKRETLATLVQITTKTLELKKVIAKSMADEDDPVVDFGYIDLVLAHTNICDALKLIDKTRDFLCVAKKGEENKESQMKRPMNNYEAFSARKALCNAETYIRTIRESLWNDPEFDDVEKTLEDLEQVRSVVNRICDAIPVTFKVKKPVSELVLGENGEVSIRCFDPEKGYCREESQEEYESTKGDDAEVGTNSETEQEDEQWTYIKKPSGREKRRLDAMKAIYDMIDVLFKLKFRIEKKQDLSNDVQADIDAVSFVLSILVKDVLEETK